MTTSRNTKPMAEGNTALERLNTLPPEKKAMLLDAATAAFAENGFAGASMNAILKAARMSKGQAYYYVNDKADLYAAVIDNALERLITRVDFSTLGGAVDVGAFWSEIYEFFGQLVDVLIEDPVLAALGQTMYEGGQTETALAGPLGRIRDAADLLVQKGQSIGAIRSDMPRTLIVDMLLAAGRALDRWFARNWGVLAPEEARRINTGGLDMIRAMAAP